MFWEAKGQRKKIESKRRLRIQRFSDEKMSLHRRPGTPAKLQGRRQFGKKAAVETSLAECVAKRTWGLLVDSEGKKTNVTGGPKCQLQTSNGCFR